MGQKQYVDAIREKMIVFGIGPAGTGKTYLAMAMAIQAFKNGDVARIILTRPAIEAGEKLGFLPGDLQSKVDPYLRPLYDALHQIMGAETFLKNMEKGLIAATICQQPFQQGSLSLAILFAYLAAGEMPVSKNNYVDVDIRIRENL